MGRWQNSKRCSKPREISNTSVLRTSIRSSISATPPAGCLAPCDARSQRNSTPRKRPQHQHPQIPKSLNPRIPSPQSPTPPSLNCHVHRRKISEAGSGATDRQARSAGAVHCEGFLQGLHASPFHGFSVEFSEHRKYTPGDDPKDIDWLVYAKTDKYYVKKFEAETNITGYLVMDLSRSMGYTYRRNSPSSTTPSASPPRWPT